MAYANIKLSTHALNKIKKLTGEKTGQKAIQNVLDFFFRMSNQAKTLDVLKSVEFKNNFNPLKLRKKER